MNSLYEILNLDVVVSVGAELPCFRWALSFVIWCLLGIDIQDGSRQMDQVGDQVISHEFQV